ncbi:TonB-dependent receptor [Hyphococcus luteus]|uniref:Secretin/TonB short N-terminal domain-containing protein n=1 Tax=Hyphococcus luteus TaxID=2058213 RepID=A0A2S7K767_9PROT|nr:TonB-dependent receptor [Marinicaulis flavus]PQA88319.1 hypothetical protein CW354_08445 [Marinicaulis flavus]
MSTENQATTYRTRSNRKKFLMGSGLSALAGCFMMSAAAAQKPAEPVKEFHIAAQSLDAALKSYAFTTNKQVMFTTDIVEGKQATPVEGEMTDAEALQKLLAGSGLVFETRNTNVVLVRTAEQQAVIDRGAGATAVDEVEQDRPLDSKGDVTEKEKTSDEITVTGTLIKGIAPESSPTLSFDRDDIIGSGVTTTEAFLRQLPQNFGGGSTEFTPAGLPNDTNSRSNNTYATGANLRGLGSGATLTLLNGNRLAPSSTIGDFVDLSAIPVSALERIEMLTDGASSIYGGDAVAGVINFVLRDDFQGAETSVRYGTVTEGHLDEYRISQLLGKGWKTGNVMAAYEYLDRDNLRLSDKPDIPTPTLSNGDPIEELDQLDLMPAQKRHSGVFSARQEIGSKLEIDAMTLVSSRHAESLTVGGVASSDITQREISSDSLSANLGADYQIGNTWTASVDANFSQVKAYELAQGIAPLNDPTWTRTNSSMWSVDVLTSGSVFELPAGDIKAAVGGQFRRETLRNRLSSGSGGHATRDVTAVFGELYLPVVGQTNAIPGIARLEVNASGRFDDYSDFGNTVNPKVGVLWSPVDGFSLRGSYSTSFAPPALGRSYASRAGAVFPYSFIRGLLNIDLPDPSLENVDYLIAQGVAADLDPETSRAFTAGMDYSLDHGGHSLTTKATYYDIKFDGRLGTTPIPQNLTFNHAPGIAFDNPDAFPPGTIVFFPSDEEVQSLISTFTTPLQFRSGATDLENIGFINNALIIRNLASTITRGVEVQLDYEFDTGRRRYFAGINANYIIDFIQQASVTSAPVERINSLYNPIDLQLRGHLGVAQGGFGANLFINHKASYRTDDSDASVSIDPWTTADLSLSYRVANKQAGWLDNTAFNLTILNILDQSPPETPTYLQYRLTGYDPANASPLGRFVAFDIRKSF